MLEFQIRPSQRLLQITLGFYLLAVIALLVTYSFNGISVLLLVLIILLAVYEWQYYKQQGQTPTILRFHLSSSTIEYESQHFSEYSVYTCRWAMILVLKKPEPRRRLTLVMDRFTDESRYLDLRYHLIRLNQAMHAS